MRFVSIGKPHMHHERISIVGAFNPIGARLWFQSHRDKSHFPNCPMVAKNLRLERTSARRSSRRRRIAPGTQSKHSGFVPRGTQSLPPAGPQDSFSSAIGVPPTAFRARTHRRRSWSRGGAVPVGLAASNDSESWRTFLIEHFAHQIPGYPNINIQCRSLISRIGRLTHGQFTANALFSLRGSRNRA
jgi:hypothetical protein